METTTQFDIEALPVKITYVAEVPSPWDKAKKTNCDQWRVVIETKAGYWSTDYWTGIGLRETVRGFKAQYIKNAKIDRVTGNYTATKPKTPKVADVIYSLFSDARAADENFHDWCESYGYSDDSIAAMNTYKQCLEIAMALRRHFSPEQRAQIELVIQDM